MSKKSRTWLLVAILFIVILGFYFLVYRNIVLKTEYFNEKIRALRTQVQVKTRVVKKLNEYKTELTEIKEAFSKFSDYLSKPSEIPNYLVEMGNILTNYHITPLVFRPGEEKFENGKIYGTFPIELEIKCDYFTLIKVLDRFENGNKLVYVEEVSLEPSDKNSIDAKMRVSLLLQKEGVKF